MMRSLRWRATAAAAMALAALSSCGGGGSGSGSTAAPGPVATGTPAPSPTPSPTPVAFEPIEAQLFVDSLYNPDLVVGGHGWIAGLTPPVTPVPFENVTVADALTVTYDAAAKAYRVTGPLIASGTLFQVSARQSSAAIAAAVAADKASAKGLSQFSLSPGEPNGRARYIAELYAYYGPASLNQLFFGAFAVAQPTKDAEAPASGTATYDGKLTGSFSQDPGGTGLEAEASFEIDFGKGTITGNFTPQVICMMGCSYPAEATYTLANVHKTSASSFTGDITAPGAPAAGTFTAILAGPGAAELLMTVSFPFRNPEYDRWLTFGGYFVAKKAP